MKKKEAFQLHYKLTNNLASIMHRGFVLVKEVKPDIRKATYKRLLQHGGRVQRVLEDAGYFLGGPYTKKGFKDEVEFHLNLAVQFIPELEAYIDGFKNLK